MEIKQINIKTIFLYAMKTLKEHSSFLVIVFGGGCFLLSNIMLKEIFNSTDYGFYSMVVTYISIIYIYGFLGFENVLMRFSHQISTNVINISAIQLKYIVIISTITTFVSFFGFKTYFQNQVSFSYILLFLASFFCIISLFLFSVFRLNNNFVLSQLVANGWRFFLIILSSVFFIFNWNDLTYFVDVFLTVSALIIILFGVHLFRKISFDLTGGISKKETFISFFYFFLSLTSVSILLFGDRFIIENKLGIESFGDYFYLTNLVLSPFSVLQNYVGFKQLTQFKKHFSAKIFVNFNRKITFLSLCLSMLIALSVFVLAHFDFLNFDFYSYTSTIVLLLILGMVRLYSSSMSSAYGAQTNLKTLKTTNAILISSITLIIFAVIYFCSSLNQIIIGFIIAWMIRNITLRQFLLRQLTKQTE